MEDLSIHSPETERNPDLDFRLLVDDLNDARKEIIANYERWKTKYAVASQDRLPNSIADTAIGNILNHHRLMIYHLKKLQRETE